MTQGKTARIAVDGMGGDRSPGVVVDGAVQAARSMDVKVILVGQKDRLDRELARYNPLPLNLKVQHASEVIKMSESPATSVRRKPDSSICRIVDLSKSGQADAIVSAGNTGAMVCAASLGLGML